ncbi:LuxR family transcriptional regulator [Rhizobium sp. BK376]|jgi:LuxR family quorum-sensing system transcriptional regulator SinR|uniref:helix-turn-helix transcriptional regulator n=1 Tax=Rhizobium sp. BK376 TaxID=2512149 RepID=UPI00104C85C2|nr:LuxR family transcriptional regulator [Rhizobium sp. BK376]TCR83975.1 LuxR family quorum-sensing system transcriptional regulator SinR [Rhizobium sp. BK376]
MRAGYFELFDWLEQSKPVQPREFFNRLRIAYGITHLIYVDVFSASRSAQVHRLHHTFSREQSAALASIGNEVLLPALKFVLSSVRPVDHATLRQQIPAADILFKQVSALGIPAEGISYPLLAPEARAAALVISIPLASEEIPLFLRSYGRDIQTLAALFHASMIEAERPPSISKDELRRITPREREVLRWAAAGKSYWEIAIILGITERTVRFFMSNARQKLDVVSNTQAIAEAVWRGLIPQS